MARQLAVAVAVLALAAGVIWLRQETQSEHYPTHPDSRVVITVDASTNRASETHSVQEMTAVQLTFCRLEVGSDPLGPIRQVPDHPARFQVVLQPALDATDQVQYTGCVEDWTADHLLLDVVSVERSGPVLPGEPT